MTLVHAETGEIVSMTKTEAREVTKRINRLLVDMGRVIADLEAAIKEAFDGRAWAALGFASWEEYCEQFREVAKELPDEQQVQLSHSLRSHGLSHRAIAAATGRSRSTVQRQVAQSGPPEPSTVKGIDGKTYAEPSRHANKTPRSVAPVYDACGIDDSYNEALRCVTGFLDALVAGIDNDEQRRSVVTRLLTKYLKKVEGK